MDLDAVDVVLVRPARAANVGAACRALRNMGLGSLTLVGAEDLDLEQARPLAWGAWDVLSGARRVPSLAVAVADVNFVVATSGREARAWSPRQLAADLARRPGRAAIVFGPEADGLSRAERDLCHERVRIPTGEAQPSLNLAQAVLLIAYELRLGLLPAVEGSAETAAWQGGVERERAEVSAVEAALEELKPALVDLGYLDARNPEAVFAELRRMLFRAGPDPREATLLRGLARQLRWAGRRVAEQRTREERGQAGTTSGGGDRKQDADQE